MNVPQEEHAVYAGLLRAAVMKANVVLTTAQYLLVVDRSPTMQAGLVLWGDGEGRPLFVGGSPVSTGRPGAYERLAPAVAVEMFESIDAECRT